MSTEERTKILQMLKDGLITVDEAEKLLAALQARGSDEGAQAIALKDSRGRKRKNLRIIVDARDGKDGKSDKALVNIRIPVSIVRALGPVIANNLPSDARSELDKQGIDLAAILAGIDDLLEQDLDDDIINVDAGSAGDESAKVRIYVD